MKTKSSISKALGVAFLALVGVSSPLTPGAHGANRFLGYFSGKGRAVDVPIETVSGRGAEISGVRIREEGGRYFISGSVKRQVAATPVPGSHVDIVVRNASRKIVASRAVSYTPRPIPYEVRGIGARSTFSASLGALPAGGASVKVVFHNAGSKECGAGRNMRS